MRGLLARVRGAAGPSVACVAGGDSELEVALRRVTHSDCAVVPPESLAEVVRLAAESEESLAVVLRHIEESASAPPAEWRRVHGALRLFERLIRHGRGTGRSGADEPLVGQLWFEAKLEERLKALLAFEYAEDRRVALLVRRAAGLAQAAAEAALAAEGRAGEACSSYLPGPSSPAACAGGTETPHQAVPAPSKTANPQDGSRAQAAILGRACSEEADKEAHEGTSRSAITSKLHSAASALAALDDPCTRSTSSPVTRAVASSPVAERGVAQPGTPPSGWCCCSRRRPANQPAQLVSESTDNSECETFSLLAQQV